jgi:hypothetical protein
MKAMKISFEQKSEVYPGHVINGVKESLKESEEWKSGGDSSNLGSQFKYTKAKKSGQIHIRFSLFV